MPCCRIKCMTTGTGIRQLYVVWVTLVIFLRVEGETHLDFYEGEIICIKSIIVILELTYVWNFINNNDVCRFKLWGVWAITAAASNITPTELPASLSHCHHQSSFSAKSTLWVSTGMWILHNMPRRNDVKRRKAWCHLYTHLLTRFGFYLLYFGFQCGCSF